MSGSDARALSRSLLDLCRMRKLTIATAESCTGGLVAGALTDIPGSSDVIDRGFVTYSNDAKRAMLGVKATTLATFGAVSKETATAMAIGALEKAKVDLAVSITGIAGPNDRFPALDFDPAKSQSVSPIFFVTADDPPSLMIHGDQDELIGIHHSEALCTKVAHAQLLRVEGAGHSDVHKFPSFRKALAGALGSLA